MSIQLEERGHRKSISGRQVSDKLENIDNEVDPSSFLNQNDNKKPRVSDNLSSTPHGTKWPPSVSVTTDNGMKAVMYFFILFYLFFFTFKLPKIPVYGPQSHGSVFRSHRQEWWFCPMLRSVMYPLLTRHNG